MRRPGGFDAHTEAPDSTHPDDASKAGKRSLRLRRLGRRATTATTQDAASPPAAESTAARLGRELRDSVLPQKVSAEVREREDRARAARSGPQDKAARRELRRAARRRRRYERKEVRRFTRRSRKRKVILLVAAGTAVTMGALVAVAVYSPLLALRTISIDGTARIDPADLENAVDGQLGTPLALLDESEITDQLGDFPLIRSFVTETRPPDTLVIHVVERQPIGTLPTLSGFALVDPAGIVIERSASRIPGVPLIDIGGDEAGSAAFDAAVEVLVALPDSILSQLDTITATTRDDVRLAIATTGATIVWGGADRSDYKAQVLAALLANVPTASEFNVSAPGQGTYKP